jgi:hypothetical protein
MVPFFCALIAAAIAWRLPVRKKKATSSHNARLNNKANQVLIKGGSHEENHYFGNGFGDDACIYWRMLGKVGCRWQGWKR